MRPKHVGAAICSILIIGVLVADSLGPEPVDARLGNSDVVELVGQIGGGATSVQIAGNYAYIAAGSRLVIADITDLPNISVVGETTTLPNLVGDLALEGQHVYLAANEAGLRVVDVSDAESPAEVGFTTGFDADGGIAIAGGHLFAASGKTLRAVDISDPNAPRVVGTYEVALPAAWDVAVAGGVAYAATSDPARAERGRLELVDVSDPANPSLLGFIDLEDRAFVVAASDGLCFVAGGGQTVQVVDVSDPSQPNLIGETSVRPGYDASSIVEQDGRLYVRYHNIGVAVVDVSDPANPRHTSTILTHRWSRGGLAIEGDRLFVANDYDTFSGGGPRIEFHDSQAFWGLEVFDVGDPDDAVWSGGLSDLWYGVAAGGVDDVALVAAAGAGLRIVDTSDPADPREIGAAFPVADLTDVVYSGGFAYATSALVGRLLVYDLSDRTNPVEVAAYTYPGHGAYSVAIEDDRAYVVLEDELTVLDITAPTGPALLGTYVGLVAHRPQVAVRHPHVFVAGRTPGSQGILEIIDVSDPASPSRVGRVRFPDEVSGVAADGSYVYIAGATGLEVVDVGAPSEADVIGGASFGWEASGIAFSWPYAFVTGVGGVAVVDVAEPSSARIIARLDHESGPWLNPERPTRPWLAGDLLYVPQFDLGLLIVRHSLDAVATHTPTPTNTATATATATSTMTPSTTVTATPSPTLTATLTTRPSPIATATVPPTERRAPTQTATAEPAHTTASATPSPTANDSSRPSPATTGSSTPSPVSSAEPSPMFTSAPTPSADPTPIYLPLSLSESCPPKGLFSDVVLVIDASTSMRDATADRRRKIDVALASANVFLDGLRLRAGQDRAAIVTFNVEAAVLQHLTSDREILGAALSRVRIAEQSRVDLGVERAMVELITRGRPRHVQAMVVLSDGKANPAPGDYAIAAALRAQLEDITVYVVGMGPSMDERVLRQMASGPERYFPAPDPLLLHSIYQDLTRHVPCPPEAYWGRR